MLATHEELVMLDDVDLPPMQMPTWLVCHRSLRHVPRVQVVWDWLLSCLLVLDDVADVTK